ALEELAEAPARRTVGAPHRLDLVALEQARQLVLILRDDARQRHGQVVAQREIGLAAGLVLAAPEDLENQLVAFLAVLARQRLDVLERRRLERLEAVALVDPAHHADDVFPAPDVVGEEVAGTRGRFRGLLVGQPLNLTSRPCTRGGSRRSGRRRAGFRRLPPGSAAASPCRGCPSPATWAAPSCSRAGACRRR